VAPFLWISGRLLAGKQNAKGTNALWSVLIGTLVFYFFDLLLSNYIVSGFALIISYIVMLIIWLALLKHFFNCGWIKALTISIIAVIIAVIVIFTIFLALTLIGNGTNWTPVGNPLNSFYSCNLFFYVSFAFLFEYE
jgi:hypothetical protein